MVIDLPRRRVYVPSHKLAYQRILIKAVLEETPGYKILESLIGQVDGIAQ